MLRALHSILLIGWDFDLRIRPTPDDDGSGNVRLGDVLPSRMRQRPERCIYILTWNMAVLYTMRVRSLPMLLTDGATWRRIHLRFDSAHPATSAHRQKTVAIDDLIAFCGSIDMTDHRRIRAVAARATVAASIRRAIRTDPCMIRPLPLPAMPSARWAMAGGRLRCATGQNRRRPEPRTRIANLACPARRVPLAAIESQWAIDSAATRRVFVTERH